MTALRATPGRIITAVFGVPLMLAGIAWSAFTLIGVLARTSEHHHASYAWSGGAVSLNVVDGNVQIRAADTRTVNVDFTEHYQLKRPTVRASSTAAGVALSGKCAGGVFGQNCSINYVITVPRQAALQLHLGDGDLTLDGVTASVVAHSGDGDINGSGLRSKSFEVSSGDGGIHLQWAAAPSHVSLSMGDGSIDLTVPNGSGPYAIRQSGSGGSDIKVATDPSAAATMVLRTGDGDVRVHYVG
jgi:hypothetical protein